MLQIAWRKLVHQGERPVHQAARVERSGIGGHLLQRLAYLSLDADLRPDVSELVQRLQRWQCSGPRRRVSRREIVNASRRAVGDVIEQFA